MELIVEHKVGIVTDKRIIKLLRMVAETPPKRNRRGLYLANAGDENQNRWLMARHIGHSTRRDQRLLKRLKQMAKDGKIEQFDYCNMPRFRAKR